MTAPAVASTQQNALQLLDQQFTDRKAEFQAALPNNCTVERFTRIVKTAAIQNPSLLTADRPSLFMACFKAAQDGLLPDGRECALVIYPTKQKNGTYRDMVQYMPMYGGILKKVRNSGELASIAAHVVYEEDKFDYCLGDDEHIIHKPSLVNNGKAICAYVIVKTKDGAVYREVMTTAEIEKIRLKSKMKDGLAWKENWGEMA
ncbi:MAG TPA: recombinase RecT, partial [Gammaproteobacteria bacterium]|nr:recombinase RecT [Gammaproteobacteria bacterium]